MTPFEKASRKTKCVCGAECLRTFTKTRDGRPWPAQISFCIDCQVVWCNSIREFRIKKTAQEVNP